MIKITDFTVDDVRFPTSKDLTGSDAIHTDPDYSATYVTVYTSDNNLKGFGLAFTIGKGNDIVAEAIENTRGQIAEGKAMVEPLLDSGVFPAMVCSMIAVGEQSGALDVMLTKIADFYDDEVDSAVDGLTSMIEPFLMVFLGGTIGTLVIAMYLPIFDIINQVG